MSNHSYHDINLYITWHIFHELPMTPEVEETVHNAIVEKCRMTEGVFLHEVGGTETHVHIAVSIDSKVLISNLIGEIKGSVSHEVNSTFMTHPVNWKRGYGVVSFGKQDLIFVLAYIKNQKIHHQRGTISLKLEQTEDD